jgi:ArsR family transcriptional regulator, arsenate/arsenite/antimonite-responsive transcriptional repressor
MNIQKIMKAISDSKRRKILFLLKKQNLSAGEISKNFDISFAAISRHLSILQDAQLVESERKGKNIIYSLNMSLVEEMLLFINNIFSKDNTNI